MNRPQTAAGELRERQVEPGQRIDRAVALETTALVHVADHPDHFAIGAVREDDLSNRIAVLEVSLCKGLVDDDGRRGSLEPAST